jgi:hypothetical protein
MMMELDTADVMVDEALETFHGVLEVANLVATCCQRDCNHLNRLWDGGIGGAQGRANGSRRDGGISESPATAMGYEIDQLIMGHEQRFSDGEFGQKKNAGGTQAEESLTLFPGTAFEEGIGQKATLLPGYGLGEATAIAGQPAQSVPEGDGHVGDGQLIESQRRGDMEDMTIIVLADSQHRAVPELGHKLGSEADQLLLAGLQERLDTQVMGQGVRSIPVDPQPIPMRA